MLRRWHRRAYDIGLLLGISDLVLESLSFRSGIGRGQEAPKAPLELCVKALVLKEVVADFGSLLREGA
jgi:hypothetical protein